MVKSTSASGEMRPPLGPASTAIAQLEAIAPILSRAESTVESILEGTSMVPTIPPGTPIRLECGARGGEVGEVVAIAKGAMLTVHRVVATRRQRDGRVYVLTCGDNRWLPDSPVESDRIIGRVVAIKRRAEWVAVSSTVPSRRSRALVIPILRLMLWISPRGTRALGRVAGIWRAKLRRPRPS
jgi:hypothetical protein